MRDTRIERQEIAEKAVGDTIREVRRQLRLHENQLRCGSAGEHGVDHRCRLARRATPSRQAQRDPTEKRAEMPWSVVLDPQFRPAPSASSTLSTQLTDLRHHQLGLQADEKCLGIGRSEAKSVRLMPGHPLC